jgi:hypothetical protein
MHYTSIKLNVVSTLNIWRNTAQNFKDLLIIILLLQLPTNHMPDPYARC